MAPASSAALRRPDRVRRASRDARHEGERHHDRHLPVLAVARISASVSGPIRFQRPDLALMVTTLATLPPRPPRLIAAAPASTCADRIASRNDPLRQPWAEKMRRGVAPAGTPASACAPARHSRHEPGLGRIATDRRPRRGQPGPLRRARHSSSDRPSSSWRTADRAGSAPPGPASRRPAPSPPPRRADTSSAHGDHRLRLMPSAASAAVRPRPAPSVCGTMGEPPPMEA